MNSGSKFTPEPKAVFSYYCPQCNVAVTRPLVCGDCLAVICRECGSALEESGELGVG